MPGKFLTRSAVMLILLRTNNSRSEVLLQKRANTGYADGLWDCAASGHVDANESMKMAVVREAYEELGIQIALTDVRFATIIHKYTPETNDIYYNGFFIVTKYAGTPFIKEPHKCSDIKWFSLTDLPDDLLPDRAAAITNFLNKIPYAELGWDCIT